MPYIYSVIFLIGIIWNAVYVFSYALYEKKAKNLKGFVALCILFLVAVCLFLVNFVTY